MLRARRIPALLTLLACALAPVAALEGGVFAEREGRSAVEVTIAGIDCGDAEELPKTHHRIAFAAPCAPHAFDVAADHYAAILPFSVFHPPNA